MTCEEYFVTCDACHGKRYVVHVGVGGRTGLLLCQKCDGNGRILIPLTAKRRRMLGDYRLTHRFWLLVLLIIALLARILLLIDRHQH